MITYDRILRLVEEKVEGTEHFLVELKMGEMNDITIIMDGDEGFNIQDCILFNRHMEQSLDREVEDFSLQVMSPGLDQPFKNVRQYVKNVGRDVKVRPVAGRGVEGTLIAADEVSFTVKTRRKERIEGRKAKHWVEEDFTFKYNETEETKVVIAFNSKGK